MGKYWPPARHFWNAAAFQWVNPKALVMAVSSAALFVPAGSDMLHGISVVSLGFFRGDSER
jgi:threonine/homoserine/homoserine lactone efflux protein